jgi:CheY-like chemotaxis protein
MARVLALVPDLLFGSKLKSSLTAEGHDVELVGPGGVSEGLEAAELLIVDLTDPDLDGPGIVRALGTEGALEDLPTLGFYSHVDVDVREEAEQAGFDLVVPRSRMAREGAELAAQLLKSGS